MRRVFYGLEAEVDPKSLSNRAGKLWKSWIRIIGKQDETGFLGLSAVSAFPHLRRRQPKYCYISIWRRAHSNQQNNLKLPTYALHDGAPRFTELELPERIGNSVLHGVAS